MTGALMIPRKLITATLSAAVGATIALSLAGCDFFVPQTTETTVETSDGVSGQTGKVFVGNAVLVTGEEGQLSNLVVTLVNEDFVDHDVSIQDVAAGAARLVIVPAGSTVQLGTPDNQKVLFVTVDSPPGSLHPLTFMTTNSPLHLAVPVLDGGLPQYKDLTPPAVSGTTAAQDTK
ncbi:hypothetical protein [Diaminobutyricibacter sp. McL0608]|uniref:hypothetical protein n=1 Tax=Leifsonia sp. McL0608 TaxID=3143537 RepID=UPI0031F2E5C5